MRSTITCLAAIISMAVSAAACTDAAAPPRTPDPCDVEHGGKLGLARCPRTGDPIPEEAVANAACQDDGKGATRWLGRTPHVPLAIVDSTGILEAGQECCAPWARRGSKWNAIDAWGQIAGKAVLSGGEGYDVTACFELTFTMESGRAGSGLFASAEGSYKPGKSARWEPSPELLDAFREFMHGLEESVVDHGVKRFEQIDPVPGEAPMFFQVPALGADGKLSAMDHYAVSAGHFLVVAFLGEDGGWHVAHLDSDMTNWEGATVAPYRLVGVMDMDADDVPEIVYYWTEGPSWSDVILRRNTPRTAWTDVASSVGGDTI